MESLPGAEKGGFGGGPGQIAHCAPTYASVLALCTTGTSEALRSIDRKAIYRFFLAMKTAGGGFTMHLGGEVDSRYVKAQHSSQFMHTTVKCK